MTKDEILAHITNLVNEAWENGWDVGYEEGNVAGWQEAKSYLNVVREESRG